jgi:hypothetical protein
VDKKRKRTNSLTSQDTLVAGPSNERHPHPSLVNRLSLPESKKARKRRRRVERQAQEEARLKNISWHVPTFEQSALLHMSGVPTSHSRPTPGPFYVYRYGAEDVTMYDNYQPPSISPPPLPPPPTSKPLDWVSSMAMAAGDPGEELESWSPLSTLVPPPSTPPHFPPPAIQPNPPSPTPSPPVPPPQIIHALPPKPPPPPVPPIGMMPDQDPNSKHGTFSINSSTKEAGTDMKKRQSQYIPNPARTLVIEQLPKTHRHPDFINNWSRSACGFLPVHIFIDASVGKALIEFATAELARKAWASPKLGNGHAGLKSHQLKGKPREDLIKVWWYRVDGVGAGAGVGEIEEGEIEGDTADKEVETLPKKETKKERKARLAKEREEKRVIREAEFQDHLPQQSQRHQPSAPLPNQKQQYNEAMNAASRPQQNFSLPTLSSLFMPNMPTSNGLGQPLNPLFPPPVSLPYASLAPSYPSAWQAISSSSSAAGILKAAYEASLRQAEDVDNEDYHSIASSAGSASAPLVAFTASQADDLSDFEEDMDVDVEEKSIVAPRASQPLPPQAARPPLHSSLPPRPGPMVTGYASRPPPPKQPPPPLPPPPPSSGLGSQPHTQNLPPAAQLPLLPIAAPQPKIPQAFVAQELSGQAMASLSSSTTPVQSSGSSSTASATPIPSEPKAMKNAPTEPSFQKRALMARQKELEEKIAKSKLELAAATAKSGVKSGAATPPTTTSLPPTAVAPVLTPAMDLGEKQAMEDRLRKLVLQSQKARGRGKVEALAPTATTAAASVVPRVTTPVPLPPQQQQNWTQQAPSSSSASATVSISSHSFSLEDMAVSFITQTIETIKSKPFAPPPPAAKPMNSNVRFELAAKHKRLEEHILESKALMAKLSQARSKEEKDGIMKVMREKSRCVFFCLCFSPCFLVSFLCISPPFRSFFFFSLHYYVMLQDPDG